MPDTTTADRRRMTKPEARAHAKVKLDDAWDLFRSTLNCNLNGPDLRRELERGLANIQAMELELTKIGRTEETELDYWLECLDAGESRLTDH